MGTGCEWGVPQMKKPAGSPPQIFGLKMGQVLTVSSKGIMFSVKSTLISMVNLINL